MGSSASKENANRIFVEGETIITSDEDESIVVRGTARETKLLSSCSKDSNSKTGSFEMASPKEIVNETVEPVPDVKQDNLVLYSNLLEIESSESAVTADKVATDDEIVCQNDEDDSNIIKNIHARIAELSLPYIVEGDSVTSKGEKDLQKEVIEDNIEQKTELKDDDLICNMNIEINDANGLEEMVMQMDTDNQSVTDMDVDHPDTKDINPLNKTDDTDILDEFITEPTGTHSMSTDNAIIDWEAHDVPSPSDIILEDIRVKETSPEDSVTLYYNDDDVEMGEYNSSGLVKDNDSPDKMNESLEHENIESQSQSESINIANDILSEIIDKVCDEFEKEQNSFTSTFNSIREQLDVSDNRLSADRRGNELNNSSENISSGAVTKTAPRNSATMDIEGEQETSSLLVGCEDISSESDFEMKESDVNDTNNLAENLLSEISENELENINANDGKSTVAPETSLAKNGSSAKPMDDLYELLNQCEKISSDSDADDVQCVKTTNAKSVAKLSELSELTDYDFDCIKNLSINSKNRQKESIASNQLSASFKKPMSITKENLNQISTEGEEKEFELTKDSIDDFIKSLDDIQVKIPTDDITEPPQNYGIYTDKECINNNCLKKTNVKFEATIFMKSYYGIRKSSKHWKLFVCKNCYEAAMKHYNVMCDNLISGENFDLTKLPPITDCIEIEDSDEEDATKNSDSTTKTYLDENTMEMIEQNLDDLIAEQLKKYDTSKQIKNSISYLSQRAKENENELRELGKILKNLDNTAQSMFSEYLKYPEYNVQSLGEVIITDSGTQINPTKTQADKIEIGKVYLCSREDLLQPWIHATVTNVKVNEKFQKVYCLTYAAMRMNSRAIVRSGDRIAFNTPPADRLPIGSRVVSHFLKKGNSQHQFFSGIVAETLSPTNNNRYLIFFDDGYAQYVSHADVRLICQPSERVWENVDIHSREFIRNYLNTYNSMRPLIVARIGHNVLTEVEGKWINARILRVDCSLVLISFPTLKRVEWIYRGSSRFWHIYNEMNNKKKNKLNRRPTNILYSQGPESMQPKSPEAATAVLPEPAASESVVSKPPMGKPPLQLAKKSTAKKLVIDNTMPKMDITQPKTETVETKTETVETKPEIILPGPSTSSASTTTRPIAPKTPTVNNLNQSTIYITDSNKPTGQIIQYRPRFPTESKIFVPHICSPNCLKKLSISLGNYHPLAKPLITGWERRIQVRSKKNKQKIIAYMTPCAIILNSINEVREYLRKTKCDLNVDNFDFDPNINCLEEYKENDPENILLKDISNGKEGMPISCVNCFDKTLPPPCDYSAIRLPSQLVNLNTNPDFLSCCDCEDDCLDKSKCACWKLTVEGAKYFNPYITVKNVGYIYKRLLEQVPTGIYECNSRCKCSKNCLNRVVQEPIQLKLQVFKTSNRGWGLRCLNDIPRGGFICCYAGKLLSEQEANDGTGDDKYLADLDYIEVVEDMKNGYEATAPEMSDSETSTMSNDSYADNSYSDDPNDESFTADVYIAPVAGNKELRKKKKERKPINLTPSKSAICDSQAINPENGSIRTLYDGNSDIFVMDAKEAGNIGKYFNHSCSPNLFVQNVFVDTHDLRFPWIAFFAQTMIRAGSELTWDYGYTVGSVPGKILYCMCGAQNCRKRIL